MRFRIFPLIIATAASAVGSPLQAGGDFSAEEIEFFESRIRPVLAQECYECHNSRDKAKSGLILDYRDGIRKGGDLGPAIVPGDSAGSLLIEALKHEYDITMPKAGVKLDPPIIADFEKWIDMGAPDPRDIPPTEEELAEDTSWEAILETRKNWWSFQPVAVPETATTIDAYLNRRLEEERLTPAPEAEPAVVARRLHFVLTGLPPTPAEMQLFEKEAQSDAHVALANLTERLLDSPHFGEHWARHWMDWIRYAESHGSEGDPLIDHAYFYRDYLIRALNEDVPYNQLVKEHVAGDLLDEPRIDRQLGINESRIATTHWRMVFHGFAPTDALDEKVRFTDDQINVFSKAFQALTVSCARCHNHKFDAISQADYYALFGILGSTRPGRKLIDLPESLEKNKAEMAELKPKIRSALANDWLSALDGMGESLPVKWDLKLEQQRFEKYQKRKEGWQALDPEKQWNLRSDDEYQSWFRYGNGLPSQPAEAGAFAVASSGESAVADIFPSGVYSHLLSDKHAARLTSPDFHLDGEYELFVLARGEGKAMLRYVVQNYPRSGTVFKVIQFDEKNAGDWKWHQFDIGYWNGDDIHIELATARDAPLLTQDSDRSWFGIREAVLVRKGSADDLGGEMPGNLALLFDSGSGKDFSSGSELTQQALMVARGAIERWENGTASDKDALFLDRILQDGLLPNQINDLPAAGDLIRQYRELEKEVPVPTRVHGLDEWTAHDQPLYDRGDHKKPLDTVPRRFLEAIDPEPYQSHTSGRLELAEDLLRPDNPFTRRVIVNRIWHHVFGAGIVPTTDNFGRMGEKPSHPELLDSLAVTFSDDFDWSIKSMIRQLVNTDAFRRSSISPDGALAADPDNRLLSHFSVNRLEAESVRDALLSASGDLDMSLFGTPVGGKTPRRSVYVNVIRNRLDPFLQVFDAPIPFSAVGRRPQTNVPAQSLTMLNDPFVVQAADDFASSVKDLPPGERISRMWETAFGRQPSEAEHQSAEAFLAELSSTGKSIEAERSTFARNLEQLRQEKNSILQLARKKLEAAHKSSADSPEKALDLRPLTHWNFAQGANDLAGDADLELSGDARLEDGALVVGGAGFAKSPPLAMPLLEKTLEVRVKLSTPEQKAGGAMTVQDLNGSTFDGIVYAERRPYRWLSGSNRHQRTKDFNGTDETAAAEKPVHLAIVYKKDGTVIGYREGVPYGEPYKAESVQNFDPGKYQVVLGIRHGTSANGNRMLTGKIYEARLFDRALSKEEVAAAAGNVVDFVTDTEVFDSLTEQQRARIDEIDSAIGLAEQDLESLGDPFGEEDVWKNFAHTLFNMKEFIYVY